MTERRIKTEQVAQPFWKEKAPAEWKKIYQDEVEEFMRMNLMDPTELEATVAICKEIISQVGDKIKEWKTFPK